MLLRRWTMVGDAVIHSRETADGLAPGARPLVLVHGVGSTTRYFRPLLHELDGRAPAAAVELPGIGQSSADEPPDTIAGQADVIADWLRTTGRRPSALVGNSMGAQTVVELAIRHPELAERLVLIGPTIDAAERSQWRQFGRLVVDATLERPSLIPLSISDTFLTRRRVVRQNFRASLAHHLEERIPLVSVPILILRGEHDPLVPRRWARQLVTAAPRAHLFEVTGAAHACHHGRPRVVAELLVDAIAGASPPPAAPHHR